MNERSPQRVKARSKGVTGYKSVMRPTKYGNPFPWKEHGKQWAVDQFRRWLAGTAEGQAIAIEAKSELRGSDLGCTCPLDGPCHGDVLLIVANEPPAAAQQDEIQDSHNH
jgi:hypothetical protein